MNKKKQIERNEEIVKIDFDLFTTEEIVAIFAEMGFEVAEGPDIEDQFHNFNALNMPPNHPARQMQDTFYVNNDIINSYFTTWYCSR